MCEIKKEKRSQGWDRWREAEGDASGCLAQRGHYGWASQRCRPGRPESEMSDYALLGVKFSCAGEKRERERERESEREQASESNTWEGDGRVKNFTVQRSSDVSGSSVPCWTLNTIAVLILLLFGQCTETYTSETRLERHHTIDWRSMYCKQCPHRRVTDHGFAAIRSSSTQ